MVIADILDGNKLKEVRRIVVDGIEVYSDKTVRLEYNMVDRLVTDRAAAKTVVVEFK